MGFFIFTKFLSMKGKLTMKMRSTKAIALLLALILCLGSALPALAYEHGEVVEDDGTETAVAAPEFPSHGSVVEETEKDSSPAVTISENEAETFSSPQEQNSKAILTAETEEAVLNENGLLETPMICEEQPVAANGMRRAAAREAVRGTLVERHDIRCIQNPVSGLTSLGHGDGSISYQTVKALKKDGKCKVVYCLEYMKPSADGIDYSESAPSGYDEKMRALIGDIIANGWQYSGDKFGKGTPFETERYKFCATQMMIWAALGGNIYYDSNGVITFKDCVSHDVELIAMQSGFYNEYYAYFFQLKNKLIALRKIPSFAYRTETEAHNKEPLLLPANEDGTFSFTAKDVNKVLDHFDFTFADGSVTTEKAGNNLKLTANGEITDPLTSNKAIFEIEGGKDAFILWKTSGNYQPLVECKDNEIDPVAAYIAVQTGEADPDNPEQPETPQWRAIVTKRDSETGGVAQGDATLAGAVYGIYLNGALLDTYITNSAAQFTTKWYNCGEGYTLKEISPSKGYLLNPDSIPLNTKAAGEELISLTPSSPQTIIKGKVRITKHTDKGETGIETPEEGAKFRIWLTSAGSYEAAKASERDEITIDADGVAETKLLPYGTYTVHQTEGKEGTEKVNDFQVSVVKNNETYSFILNNRVFESLITVVKKDIESGRTIPAAGITFQIRDVKTGEWVVQHINYPTPQDISYFQTDSQGKLCMPEKLEYGEYELVEYATAYGYVLDTTPVPFKVDGTAKEITVEKSNMPQKGIIQLEKTGEVPDGVEEKDGFTVPKYQKAGLSGVEFTVTAAEDISTPDGTLRYVMGEKIETLVTDEEGHAETQPLYLGKYWIQETKGKDGYAIDPEKKLVTLKYTNQEESIQYQSLALENKRRELRVEKIDKQFSGRRLTGALFDLWYDKDGDKKLDKEKDELFGELTETSTGIYSLSYLPVGGFFLVETQAPALYKLDETPEYFEVRSTDVLIKREVRNEVKTGSLKILKTAEDSKVEGITFLVSGKPLAGGTYEEEFVTDENGEIFISELPIGEYTVSEVLDEESVRYVLPADQSATIIYGETAEASFYNKLRRGEVYVIKTDPDYPESKLNGAKFKVWRDTNENGKYENGEPVVGVLQEDDGTYWLDGLENGSYLLREEIAPEGYLADDNYYPFTVSANKQQVEITNTPDPEAGFVNGKLLGSLTITKESTSGTLLSGTNFCLKNKDGEVIAEGTTDEDGKLVFEELPCGEYVYQEICAPAGYETEDTEHKVSITAEKLHVEVTAVNEQTPFYVPKTGDGRMNPAFYWILLIFCTVGACAVIFLMSRTGKKKYKEKK